MGSKEAVFSLAQVLGGGRVAVPAPAYPVTSAAPLFAGKEVLALPLPAERGFLPDLDAVDAATWRDVAVLWLNYPNNPTAATAPLALYERAAELAREHDFVVASDEAYSEIYFGDPPASALQLADLTGVLVLNTLSKRSSMPGYRSGFVAGDPALIAALKRYRPNVGVAPQEFIQRAAAAAWGDEAHVEAVRAGYRAKRDVLLPVLEARGLRNAGGDATFFLWLDAGRGPRRWRTTSCARASCSSPAPTSGRPARAISASRSSRRSPAASARPSGSTGSCASRPGTPGRGARGGSRPPGSRSGRAP